MREHHIERSMIFHNFILKESKNARITARFTLVDVASLEANEIHVRSTSKHKEDDADTDVHHTTLR